MFSSALIAALALLGCAAAMPSQTHNRSPSNPAPSLPEYFTRKGVQVSGPCCSSTLHMRVGHVGVFGVLGGLAPPMPLPTCTAPHPLISAHPLRRFHVSSATVPDLSRDCLVPRRDGSAPPTAPSPSPSPSFAPSPISSSTQYTAFEMPPYNSTNGEPTTLPVIANRMERSITSTAPAPPTSTTTYHSPSFVPPHPFPPPPPSPKLL